MLICIDEPSAVTAAVSKLLIPVEVLSILVGVCHATVLSSIGQLKGKPNYSVILNIVMSDILSSVIVVARLLTKNYFLEHKDTDTDTVKMWALCQSILEFAPITRYYCVAIASVERCYAVCLPFKYETCLFVRYIKLWIVSTWAFTAVMVLIRDTLLISSLCVSPAVGVFSYDSAESVVVTAVMISIPLCITVTCLVRLFKELYRVIRVIGQVRPHRLLATSAIVTNASRYLLFTTLSMSVCLVAPTIVYCFTFVLNDHLGKTVSIVLYTLLSSWHGMTSMLICLHVSSAYRRRCQRMFSVCCGRPGQRPRLHPHNRVIPSNKLMCERRSEQARTTPNIVIMDIE